MRAQDSPPDSPSLEPDRPTVEEDGYLQAHLAELATNTSSYHLSASANYESFHVSEPIYFLHSPAYAQSHHYAEGADQAGAVDEGDNDHDMLDAEEGGAPLHYMDMEETEDQPPIPLLDSDAPGIENADTFTNFIALPPPLPTTAEQILPFEPPPGEANINPAQLPQQLQQIEDETFEVEPPGFLVDGIDPHPPFLTNPNAGALMPDNPNSLDFIRYWRWLKSQGTLKDIRETPFNESSIMAVEWPRVEHNDLKGDEHDFQGINWRLMGVSRNSARKCRVKTFRNYTNRPHSDSWNNSFPDRLLTPVENYFRFRSMDLRRDVRLLHFQLRNILGCASRTRIFYPSIHSTVRELDPTTGQVRTAMRFENNNDSSVSTLATEEGILLTGSFYGTYRYRQLDTGDKLCTDGRLTEHPSGITNHVQISASRRSSVPLAAFASNDYGFRIVDLAMNKIISEHMYDFALNCSALSPDKRLRAMVGDIQNVLITEAETGEILQSLEGHRDFGFACDWAPDGWTVATGNQDKSIRIWDARKWKNSKGESTCVTVMRTEMAGIRSLRFSPLGSGKRLLLAAEEADFINIIDAQTFNSKQTVDVFGELVGMSFASGGQEVVALSSDPIRGGVISLERCDAGAEDTFNYSQRRYSRDWWRNPGYDWLPTPQHIVDHPDSQVTFTQKRRQAAMAEDWFF